MRSFSYYGFLQRKHDNLSAHGKDPQDLRGVAQQKAENARLAEESQKTTDTLRNELDSARSNMPCCCNTNDIPSMMDLESEGKSDRDDGEDDAHDIDQEEDGGVEFEAQNAKLLCLLKSLPGAPVPTVTEELDGFATSPFVDEIAMADTPKET
uniref:Uncharacterized protein n=1 Tax=Chenopodium quinoa TaxID=63459 RepID=A0A803MUG2_CHEQI